MGLKRWLKCQMIIILIKMKYKCKEGIEIRLPNDKVLIYFDIQDPCNKSTLSLRCLWVCYITVKLTKLLSLSLLNKATSSKKLNVPIKIIRLK